MKQKKLLFTLATVAILLIATCIITAASTAPVGEQPMSLKVQEKSDSMDMIKRPDAAELATTGRFYLQVGFNEFFDIQ